MMAPNQTKEIQQAGKLVREAWISQAKSMSNQPLIFAQLQRVKIDIYPGLDNIVPQKITEKTITDQITAIASLDLTTTTGLIIFSQYSLLFWNIAEKSRLTQTNQLLIALAESNSLLKRLVESIASNPDKTRLDKVRKFLCTLFDQPMQIILEHNNPPVIMSTEFMAMIKENDETLIVNAMDQEYWTPPKVSQEKLAQTLRDIKKSARHDTDPELLCSRIAQTILNTNFKSVVYKHKILEISTRYGMKDDYFPNILAADDIDYLIKEIELELLENSSNSNTKISLQVDNISDSSILSENTRSRIKWPEGRESYNSLLVDRSLEHSKKNFDSLVLDFLRHRLDFKTAKHFFYPSSSVTELHIVDNIIYDEDEDDTVYDEDAPEITTPSLPVTIYNTILNNIKHFDRSGQSEIMRLLLDRRYAAPLLVPSSTLGCTGNLNLFAYLINSFVNFKTELLPDESICVASNKSYVRVAVVSTKKHNAETSKLLKNVFRTTSLVTHDSAPPEETIGEIGLGTWTHTEKSGAEYLPTQERSGALVLHIIGDYIKLLPFLKEFTEILIVEKDPEEAFIQEEWCNQLLILDNKQNETSKFLKYNRGEKQIGFKALVRGTDSNLEKEIHFHLTRAPKLNFGKKDKTSLTNILIPALMDKEIGKYKTNLHRLSDVFTLRKNMVLQGYFRQIGKLTKDLFSTDVQGNVGREASLKSEIVQLEKKQKELSYGVANNGYILSFLKILRIPDIHSRVSLIFAFEKTIEKKLAKSNQFNLLKQDVQHQWKKYQQQNIPSAKKMNHDEWLRALELLDNSNVNVEHFWREISHLYVADPQRYGDFPELAAQHLLDGFPLEIMDGDAGMINMIWIKSVYTSLEKMHSEKQPKIFVLSILGVQSCGKSTLLNLMFGVRLRASVSRATRGVFMQLVKCEGRSKYDYVLIVDTEGVRAPEFANLNESAWRDNRMASMALLPADATIVLFKGEDHSAAKDLLPIVISVFQSSNLAMKYSGILTTKLFFVYNQINTNQSKNMAEIQQKLVKVLEDGIEEANRVRVNKFSRQESEVVQSLSLDNAFGDFKFSQDKPDESDVRTLGYLKNGDDPSYNYGADLGKLREYIHKRVAEPRTWNGKSFSELGDHLSDVWTAIQSADFHTSFKNIVERSNFSEMERQMQELYGKLYVEFSKLLEIYHNQIEIFQNDLLRDKKELSDVQLEEERQKFENRFILEISEKTQHVADAVENLAKDKRFDQWKLTIRTNYQTVVQSEKKRRSKELNNKFTSTVSFRALSQKYENDLRIEIDKLFKQGQIGPEKAEEKFEELFAVYQRRVSTAHPEEHKKVETDIRAVYTQSKTVKAEADLEILNQAFMRDFSVSFLESLFHSKSNDIEKLDNLRRQIHHLVNLSQRYSNGIVTEAILKTTELMAECSPSAKKYAHKIVFTILCNSLTEKQKEWDRKNGVLSKFIQSKSSLKFFFESRRKGIEGFKLLHAMVHKNLTEGVNEAFKSFFVKQLCTNVCNERYFSSSEVMVASLNYVILKALRNGKPIENILTLVKKPLECYIKLAENIVKKVASIEMRRQWEFFQQTVKTAFQFACTSAAAAVNEKSKKFLDELRDKLQSVGFSSAIPDYDPSYECAKDENFTDMLLIFGALDKKMYLENGIPKTVSGSLNNVSEKVVKVLREQMNGYKLPMAPRCGVPCPRCSAPCSYEAGHSGAHDASHQPQGLTGIVWKNSQTLVFESCATCVENNALIVFPTRDIPYKNFNEAYPNWTIPAPKSQYVSVFELILQNKTN
jgi:hypothetical protein